MSENVSKPSGYILSIDQGTTGTTVLVLKTGKETGAEVIGRSTINFEQYFPAEGWVEHDLEEIWNSVLSAIEKSTKAAADFDSSFAVDKIDAVGLTNQRETVCFMEAGSGKPLRKAIVWQCRRSSDICRTLKADGLEEKFKDKTGLVLDPYFSGTKVAWVFENEPELKEKYEDGTLWLGTIDTYLLARLTGGASFKTEPSNASRTLIYDIHAGGWSEELAGYLGISHLDGLAEVCDSNAVFGKTTELRVLPAGIPISGVLGDQQAALFGQACTDPGTMKCTYGTGAFMLINTGERPVKSANNMLTTVAWQVQGKLTYALEGSCFIAGAGVQYIRDQLGFFENASESENISFSEEAAPHVYFVPALTGLGAPWWNPKARGAFLGLTRASSKATLTRAVLEGIAFSVADLARCLDQDFGGEPSYLSVDGGASMNNVLMQFQADLLGRPVRRPTQIETTAIGAGLMAAWGVGLLSGTEDIAKVVTLEKEYTPSTDEFKRTILENGWKRAVKAVEVFSDFDQNS